MSEDAEPPFRVVCARAEDFIGTLADGSVSLMTLDFPYFGVKEDAWDNAWPTPEAFTDWMGGVLSKCRRVLAPNGSIYVFAASQVRGGLTMATRVEVEVARHFSVLTRITWRKPFSRAEHTEKETLRAPFPASEAIIFAEQKGSDAIALGESKHIAKNDELRGFVFEPLRTWFRGQVAAHGITSRRLNAAIGSSPTGGGMASHYLGEIQFEIPTEKMYARIRAAFPGAFEREYEDLRREYENLQRQYEALRRPFSVSAEVPYTDVWTYETVNTYPGKHPCEKPEDLARDIVRASSRPGGLVADFFCGSGAFLAAAVAEGRRAVGCDMDPHWAEQARRRCEATLAAGRIPRTAPPKRDDRQLGLFKGAT